MISGIRVDSPERWEKSLKLSGLFIMTALITVRLKADALAEDDLTTTEKKEKVFA